MPLLRRNLPAELAARFASIRQQLGVPETFPSDVVALAEQRAGAGPGQIVEDRRDIEFLSIDPEGSRDLDQALHIERRGSGYRFHYAIADVAHWVTAGDVIDVEARRRATTVYCPDERVPLHPTTLSEGAASLLEGQDRPAVLWTIDLGQGGEIEDVDVRRATVRNRRALSYTEVQAALDRGDTDPAFRLIEEVGRHRLDVERARGGVSLDLPEQSVDRVDDHYELRYDEQLAIEGWNAQLSLCCGMAAAGLMLDAKVGILRTLPAAEPSTLDALRTSSRALGVPWPDDLTYPAWVRSLDPSTPAGDALMAQAARTLRGAGYLTFDGEVPADHQHHALAADYAHVTAPLRRMIDRFANECVLAAAAGTRPPGWVTDAMPSLPEEMAAGTQLASKVDRAVVELAEAAILTHLVGHTFDAVVTGAGRGQSTVQLEDPAVIASVHADLAVGTAVTVRLVAADVDGPTVRFEPA